MKLILLFSALWVMAPGVGLRAAPAVATPSAADPWDAIKDHTFRQRPEFTVGAGRLVEKLDAQIRQLNEKRVALPETSVKDWDFAMKELNAARSYLKSMIGEIKDATGETWSEAKERVAQAWQRAQVACDKVSASTTG